MRRATANLGYSACYSHDYGANLAEIEFRIGPLMGLRTTGFVFPSHVCPCVWLYMRLVKCTSPRSPSPAGLLQTCCSLRPTPGPYMALAPRYVERACMGSGQLPTTKHPKRERAERGELMEVIARTRASPSPHALRLGRVVRHQYRHP